MPIKFKIGLAYLIVVTIWSTTPLSIQWSGQVSWFFGIAARLLISAIICLPLVFIFSSQAFSLKPPALKVYFSAALGMLGGMTPMYYAAQTMPSGWISLIFGTTPIMIGILAWLIFKNLKMTLTKITGIFISLVGLMVIIIPHGLINQSLSTTLFLGVALAFLGVFNHSFSTLLVKKYHAKIPDMPSLHIVAGTAWICSLVFILINPNYLLEWPKVPNKSIAAIAYLGSIGSVLGFILYYYLLRHLHAIKLGFITLITPILALMLGHYLNHEPLNTRIILGAGLVIFGLIFYEFGERLINKVHYHSKLFKY